jgi:HEAT repeat protein
MRAPRVVPALAVLALALQPDASAGDPAKDIRDKDVKVRIAAIEILEASGGAEAEPLLVDALHDRDWQVVERAAMALEKKGSSGCVAELITLAAEGPIRRIRITAARSAGKIDESKAMDVIFRKTTGEHVVHALEALGAIVQASQNPKAAEIVDDALKVSRSHERERVSGGRDRDPVRRAAATSLTVFPTNERVERVKKLMFDPDIGVGCAALDTVITSPDPAFLTVLLNGLGATKLDDCVDRRLRNGVRAIVLSKPDDANVYGVALKALQEAQTLEAATRLVRLVGDLAKAPAKVDPDLDPAGAEKAKNAKPIVPADAALAAMTGATDHADAGVRSAAAAALGKIGVDAAAAKLLDMAAKDADAHVRLIALRGLATTITAKDSRAFKVFSDLLADDSPLVREEAAVALGVKGVTGACPSLMKLVEEAMAEKPTRDRKKPAMKWAAATAALVSMGKTQDAAASDFLKKALHDASDWRIRASAVVGMGRLNRTDVVDELIESLDDKDICVRSSAFEFLRRMTSKDVDPTSKAWRDWWALNRNGYTFVDREQEYKRAKKYGYAPTIEGLYQGLDVVVLATRKGGDQIETMLDELKIKHRVCRAPQVNEVGLHPFALFVANCPGEIGDKDVEVLSWFVRAGGYLFSSCWALHETVERIYPGVIRKFETVGAQVIDYNVAAAPCAPDSPFVEGIFDQWDQPMYVLEGAHLIELLDRDRCDVLIDSPNTATSWGVGNLCVWNTAGHGVIFDSVNHFSHQGFHFASGLKTAEDRMAYAIDHMGVTYSDARSFMAAKSFDSTQSASKAVNDKSAFTLISNFVRLKRRVDL